MSEDKKQQPLVHLIYYSAKEVMFYRHLSVRKITQKVGYCLDFGQCGYYAKEQMIQF